MDSYVTEQQQIEQLKTWWKNYGNWLILAIVVGLLTALVAQSIRHHHEKMLIHASDHYEWLLTSVEGNNPAMAQSQARYILKRYPNTPYALLASLMQARQAVYDGDLPLAEEKLQYVMANAENHALRQASRIKLARILLSENKLDKALDTLKTVDDPNYDAAISDVEGDIYVAKGDTKSAREAYQQALSSLSEAAPIEPLIQMKLDDLATTDSTGLASS